MCAREDQATDGQAAHAESAPPGAEDGPLRGAKPEESPVDERVAQPPASAGAGGQPKAVGDGKAHQQRRVGLPADLRLRVALGPVAWLWQRLSGWQQDQVEAAAKTELARLESLLALPGGAPRLLADRLTDRLQETGGEALVNSPYGWLIQRGLVQRPSCTDRRCDDGVRLDTGTGCENCATVIHIRRAQRARIGADIDRELPGLSASERRRVLEDRLREHATAEAADLVRRREQAAIERARRDAARAAARERAERERQAAEEAWMARGMLPCEDCGLPESAGLCPQCTSRRRIEELERRTEALVQEAVELAVAARADLTDPDAVRAMIEQCERDTRTLLAAACERACGQDEAPDALVHTAPQVARRIRDARREAALRRLARSEDAEAEAQRAYQSEQNRRWYRHNPTGADAVAAATKAADTARERATEYLLTARLEQLRAQTTVRTEQAGAAPWSARLTDLAPRPLDDETAGAVIA
ncbi:hypothetical protein ACWGLF_28020 [Streptomyces puniciscabiei]